MMTTPLPPVQPQPYLMQNTVQHYAWGTRNDQAYIAQLIDIPAEPDIPYAEFWMGAHPTAPSKVIVNGDEIRLDQWVSAYPIELLGAVVAQRFHNRFPFLLKVLSAGDVLSIQAHPNKEQARILHAHDPAHYPDDNHKPEVAIALDELTALMGIKPFAELAETLTLYPEIAQFIRVDLCKQWTEPTELTRTLLTALFTRSTSHPQELESAIAALALRLNSQLTPLSKAEHLFLSLHAKYSGPDVGLFCVFLFNLVHLQPGEGMYAAAGIPHAYVRGNIIECMASSDNVVRVGLTPKFKDIPALLDIMQFDPVPLAILGTPSGDATLYPTPAAEFSVARLRPRSGMAYRAQTNNSPQMLIITAGAITISWRDGSATYRRGQSIFIPAILPEYEVTAGDNTEYFCAGIPNER